jgi:hypothetical protein
VLTLFGAMPAKQPGKYHTKIEYTIKTSMEQYKTNAG